jgi:hypothetical protein
MIEGCRWHGGLPQAKPRWGARPGLTPWTGTLRARKLSQTLEWQESLGGGQEGA